MLRSAYCKPVCNSRTQVSAKSPFHIYVLLSLNYFYDTLSLYLGICEFKNFHLIPRQTFSALFRGSHNPVPKHTGGTYGRPYPLGWLFYFHQGFWGNWLNFFRSLLPLSNKSGSVTGIGCFYHTENSSASGESKCTEEWTCLSLLATTFLVHSTLRSSAFWIYWLMAPLCVLSWSIILLFMELTTYKHGPICAKRTCKEKKSCSHTNNSHSLCPVMEIRRIIITIMMIWVNQ